MDIAYSPWNIKAELRTSPEGTLIWDPPIDYGYQKLETSSTFRLLKLEPIANDPEERHYYTLIQTTFEYAPKYETLSYVWGTTDRNIQMSLKDSKLLHITQPLQDALKEIEKHCATGYLWIDQICIDQDDLDERGHQVKVMGQIYSRCSRVLVWLGRCDEYEFGPGGRTSNYLLDPRKYLVFLRGYGEDRRARSQPESGKAAEHGYHDERLLSLYFPWFQRAWVFQEIVLPPKALFIMHFTAKDKIVTTSLDTLHDLLCISGDRGHKIARYNSANTLRNMFARWKERQNRFSPELPADEEGPCTPGTMSGPDASIGEILSLLAPGAQTSDPLDQLYAFFGLNTNPSISLTPSYGLTFEEAMVSTTTSIIRDTNNLNIFEFIPRIKEPKDYYKATLASWTPDFRIQQLVEALPLPFFDFTKSTANYTYSKRLMPQFVNDFRPLLQLHGYSLDVVHTRLGGVVTDTTTLKPYIDPLLQSAQGAWAKIKTKRRIPVSDPLFLRGKYASMPDLGTIYMAISAGASQQYFGSSASARHSPNCSHADLDPMIRRIMTGRALWMTESGRLAVGSHLRPGDEITLVYGGLIPLAIRKCVNAHVVLGSCYLDGWMDAWNSGKPLDSMKPHTIWMR